MRYCSHCGASVTLRIPEGDNLPRHVCNACERIHYENPKIVAGCIPEWGEKVLLCRRAIEPRYGLWTLPAGFMENGELIEGAAARETLEEAGAEVEILGLYTAISLPHISQVYLMFRARLRALQFGPGAESLEVRLFEEHEIPWDQLAFRAVRETLRRYFADRPSGEFPVHVSHLGPPPR
jgi:ADP-ribose pyrophosphatase YjhB (NUDIX family)